MNRCALEVGDDLVGGLSLSYAKMRRHACMVECCVGRATPQNALLCRTGYYIRLANDFLPVHFMSWQICEDTNRDVSPGTGWASGSKSHSFCPSSPAAVIFSKPASKQFLQLPHRRHMLPEPGFLWHLCSLEMDAFDHQKYTEHQYPGALFFQPLANFHLSSQVSSVVGNAHSMKKHIFYMMFFNVTRSGAAMQEGRT